ncbi:unnamed protein product [Calypogeia fissa]
MSIADTESFLGKVVRAVLEGNNNRCAERSESLKRVFKPACTLKSPPLVSSDLRLCISNAAQLSDEHVSVQIPLSLGLSFPEEKQNLEAVGLVRVQPYPVMFAHLWVYFGVP